MSNINFEEDQREDLNSVNDAKSLSDQVIKLKKLGNTRFSILLNLSNYKYKIFNQNHRINNLKIYLLNLRN